MTAKVRYADVEVGTQLPPQTTSVQRSDLVRYSGASGDFNIIHYNERFAVEVGLPNVIAHGMLTMAHAGRLITDWLGDPGALVDYGVRMTRPVVVPDDGVGAELVVSGVVTEKREDGLVLIEISALCEGQTVLGRAQALVRLS
jgi:acyl dehydratase